MLEPPSATLLKTLSALNLCTPRELKRCRAYVRRVTRDLPTFDSIWIDGLVQTRRLTAFQAKWLEEGNAERLVIGPCLLLERLGGTARAETYLARRRDANDLCVLKLTSTTPEQIKPLSERLSLLTAIPLEHPAIVVPQAAQVAEWPKGGEWRLVTISRYVRGPHLAELVVRRGRFPTSIVVEIGRQLLDGLAALEAHGLAHGEIGLTNVRITPNGQAVLVDAGHVPALRPEFSFHTILSADRYDGLAPERISNGQVPTPSSDLYSLGYLLWHLLAGRAPFTDGDPLAKVAAHQTKPIEDVREWVPDAPDWLAETLLNWTAMNPAARPKSFREASTKFGPPRRAGRRRLAQFRGEFDRREPRREQITSNSRWPLTVAMVFVLTGAVLSMFDQGARNFVLSLARPLHKAEPDANDLTTSSNRVGDNSSLNPSADLIPTSATKFGSRDEQIPNRESVLSASLREPQPLPLPSTQGRITRVTLPAGGRFLAADVAAREILEIIGDADSPAEIVVVDHSLTLWAEHIRVRGVRLVRHPNATDRPLPLIAADCQTLEVASSQFAQATELDARADISNLAMPAGDASTKRRGAALAWRPQEQRDRSRTHIDLKNIEFAGFGPAIYLDVSPANFAAENVLKVGAGDFLQWRDPGQTDWKCQLRQVTLRQSGSLLSCWPRAANSRLSRLSLELEGCVFDLAADRLSPNSGPSSTKSRVPLVCWMTKKLPSNWASAIDWQSTGVLVAPNTDIVAWIDPSNRQRTPVDETGLNIDGIVASPVEFLGPISFQSHDSELKSHNVPLPSATQLGIQAERLPQWP